MANQFAPSGTALSLVTNILTEHLQMPENAILRFS